VFLAPSHLLEVVAVALTKLTQLPAVLGVVQKEQMELVLLERQNKATEAATKLEAIISLALAVVGQGQQVQILVQQVVQQAVQGLHLQSQGHL
jgi:hypothetical protein